MVNQISRRTGSSEGGGRNEGDAEFCVKYWHVRTAALGYEFSSGGMFIGVLEHWLSSRGCPSIEGWMMKFSCT